MTSVVSYRLRPATDADVEFLAGVVVDVTRAQGRLPPGFDEARWRAGFREWTLEQITSGTAGGSTTSVIEVDGQPAGPLRVARSTELIELCGIQLRPDVQGRGIGTAVIASLQAEAAALHRPLDLAVEKDNPDAHRLYERLGFELAGETDDEYRLRWTAAAGRTGQVAGG